MSKFAGVRPRLELELQDARIDWVERLGARVVLHASQASVYAWRDDRREVADIYAYAARVVLDGVSALSADAQAILRASTVAYGVLFAPDEEEHALMAVGEVYAAARVELATTEADARIECTSAMALVGARLRLLQVFRS